MKYSVKNTLTALFTLLVLTSSVSVMANDKIVPSSVVELKFIGNLENQPVFQLNLLNKEADEFYISISDLEGNVLYSDKVKGINITRKFAINTEEVGDRALRLTVYSKNNNNKESYEISRTQNYVLEASVTRVN
jgi:hypothetical protein